MKETFKKVLGVDFSIFEKNSIFDETGDDDDE